MNSSGSVAITPSEFASPSLAGEVCEPSRLAPIQAYADARAICERFAADHKVSFDDNGECGFARPCVGFRDGNWIDHNACRFFGNFEPIPELACAACWPPDGVEAYHKHDCLAVLRRDVSDDAREEAVIQLARWVQHLEAQGSVRIVSYETGAAGLQALISGATGLCVVVDAASEPLKVAPQSASQHGGRLSAEGVEGRAESAPKPTEQSSIHPHKGASS